MGARSRILVLLIGATAIVAGCTAPQQTGANSQAAPSNDTANAVTNNGTE
jgi:uncharacterized lipoprotein YajG